MATNPNGTPGDQVNQTKASTETPETHKKVDNSVEGQRETIKGKVVRGLLALQIAVGGSGVAYAGGLPPDELAKQEKAIIEANGGIIKVDDLKGQLAKLEVKNPEEYISMYEGLDNLDKSLVGKYLNIGLKSPNNARLKNGVMNLIEGLNNKKIYTAFLQKPTKENIPEGTTASNFVNASKAFTGADLIISQEMKAEIKGLDNEMVRVRTEIANKQIKVADEQIKVADEQIKVADEQIKVADEQILDIQKVSNGIDKINELSGKIIKATGI